MLFRSIFLFWLYIVWIVILLGASLAASLTTFNDRKADWGWPVKWEFLLAYRLVGNLWKAQLEGRSCPVGILLDQLEGATETGLVRHLGLLNKAGIVSRTESGDWLLCRDLENVSLLELYQAGGYYMPVEEKLDIPSKGEWDGAFLAAIKLGELSMAQSLKSMYVASASQEDIDEETA